MLSLYNVLKIPEAKKLDEVLLSKGRSPVLGKDLGKPQNTARFMRACLRGSFLFGKHVVPTYTSNVFSVLPAFGPATDEVGNVIRKLMDLCVGELATNNIFRRAGECHCHFHDLYEAYVDSKADTTEFDVFMDSASLTGTRMAIEHNPGLWSEKSAAFANKLLDCLDNPLDSFIIMPCNEILTTVIYPPAIENLNREGRYIAFRHFLQVHVQLDGDDHGQAALDWLDLYLKKTQPDAQDIADATNRVLALYDS